MSEDKLVKKIGFWSLWALGVGSVVGDGIFLLIGQGVQSAGPISIFSYLLAGILISAAMLCICELAIAMPVSGSFQVWNKRILGRWAGTIAGFSFTAMNIVFLSSVTIAVGAISNYFFQWTDSAVVSTVIWGFFWVSTVFALSLLGAKISLGLQILLVAILVIVMLLFAIFGAASGHISSSNYVPFAPFGIAGFGAAIGLGAYAYVGPLSILTAGDEVRVPNHLPKAMLWSCITFLVLYTSSMIVMIGLVNYTSYSNLESPYTSAAQYAFGSYAGIIMNLAAWIAAYTCLVGEAYATSRLLYGMSKQKLIPDIFSRVNKANIPYVAIIFDWIITFILVVIGSIGTLSAFYRELATITLRLPAAAWLISLISVVLFKRNFSEEWNGLSWHIPARNMMLTLAFLGWAVVMYGLFSASPVTIIILGIIMLVFVLYDHFYIGKFASATS